uniref:Cytochrome b n=1 Tax=Pleodorina starrii TaxID=330485 RepID=M9P7U5_9CHLO|nr:cytochrome b [Pleodorina starrii]AFY64374.1 cytochrome b [Pleodorina starrii]
MRLHNKVQLFSVINSHLISYPTPMNLNYSWNWGSLAGLMLASQLVTGILLAMHYVGHVDYAFASVQHIMTDVPSGIILRYAHANGASLFFIVVYVHILRGFYYGSGAQPRELVWITGVVILLVMIITAFIGYVLPWGQMSFWGATVITSLATAIPVVGKHIMYWLWGGFSVDNPTLNRFYSFHYTLPFVLAGLSVFHIAALHQYGSTNPLGVNAQSSTLAFGSYFGPKDMLGVLFLALFFSILVFFYPDLLGHPDNLIPANPYSTPQHIVPEWYFVWVYAILRSIPNKAMGVVAIALVFASLFALPFIRMGGGKFFIFTEKLFGAFLADVLLLSWLGGKEITPVTSFMGLCCTAFLFIYLLGILPLIGYFETTVQSSNKKY